MILAFHKVIGDVWQHAAKVKKEKEKKGRMQPTFICTSVWLVLNTY
jgi:hypothetical protein